VTRLMEASFGLAAIALIGILYAFRPTDADLHPVPAPPGGSASADDELLASSRR
jgi:hypothetical protein